MGLDGKGRRRRTVYGKTKEEAQRKLREVQVEADAGTLADAGKLTVREYLTRWLETTARAKVHATTFARYQELVVLHIVPRRGGLRLGKLTAHQVEDFYLAMERDGVGAWTRRAVGTLLTSALRPAVRKRLIPANPALDVAKARAEEMEAVILTEAQIRKFLDSTRRHRAHALFVLAAATGMRQGELLGLQWGEVDFDKGAVSVQRSLAFVGGKYLLKEPKSRHSRRTVSLPRVAVDALHAQRARMLAEGNINAPIFCTRTGGFLNKANVTYCTFQPLLKKAGLPVVRFHSLRHFHATMLISKGYSIKAVSQRLGHARIQVTLKVYQHVLPN
jgi:integrase